MILAIDPGPTHSALVVYDPRNRSVVQYGKPLNHHLAKHVREWSTLAKHADVMAIEMIASYGMPVGAEVFNTCVWIGRLIESWSGLYELVYRREVKLHLCGSARAKDGNVRHALIDAFGGKDAIGTKKRPGPLHGIKADCWAALGVAITFADRQEQVA